jgi:hypothetical protein
MRCSKNDVGNRFFSRRHLPVIALAAAITIGAGSAQTPAPPARPVPPVIGAGTGAISGTVVDARSGRPVGGVVVYITPIAGNVAGPGAKQLTDTRGRFVFTDLGPGDAYALGTIRYGYLDGGYGRETATSTARRIVLGDGEWFQNATIKIWKPGAISGTVLDEAGEPVAGAFVRALVALTVAGRPQIAAGPTTRTDDRGAYRLAGLPPAKYFIAVPSVQTAVPAETSVLTISGMTAERVANAEASGRPLPLRRDPAVALGPDTRLLVGSYPTPPPVTGGTRPQAYPPYFHPAARDRASATPIDLTYGDERHGIDVRIAPVVTSKITGRVEGATAAIAGNVVLRLLAAGSESLGYGSETATSLVAPDGTFVFLNVPAGTYTIRTGSTSEYTFSGVVGTIAMNDLPPPPATGRMSGASAVFSSVPGTSITASGREPSTSVFGDTRVDVGANDLTGVVVTLRRGVTISGRLVPDAPPAAGRGRGPGFTVLQAEPADGDPTLGVLRSTNPQGDPTQFTIEGLRPGEYLLRVISPSAKSIAWNGKDYTFAPFDASAGQDFRDVVVTTTTQTVRIDGTVRTPAGAPAMAAVIYFPVDRDGWHKYGLQPSRLRSTITGTSGAFSITRIPAGEYFLVAVDETLANAWQDPAFLDAASRVAARVDVAWGETKTQALVIQQVRVPKGSRP